jgi:hypothetical protein
MSEYVYDPSLRKMVLVTNDANDPLTYPDEDRVTLWQVALLMAGWGALCWIVLWGVQ